MRVDDGWGVQVWGITFSVVKDPTLSPETLPPSPDKLPPKTENLQANPEKFQTSPETLQTSSRQGETTLTLLARKVDVRLPGKGNSKKTWRKARLLQSF